MISMVNQTNSRSLKLSLSAISNKRNLVILVFIEAQNNGEACVMEITEALQKCGLRSVQAHTSSLLKQLRAAFLVHSKRVGQKVYYRVNYDTIATLNMQVSKWGEYKEQYESKKL